MLGKNRTFSSINWENEHYFETLSALTLKTRNFEWKTGTCVRSAISESKSRLIRPASHSDFSVDLQGSLTAQKKSMHASVDLLPDGHIDVIVQHFWCCNLSKCCRFVHFLQWNESEHVVLPIIIIIWHSVRWISGALNEHYLKFWALNRALNAEKTRDAQSTKSKFYEH